MSIYKKYIRPQLRSSFLNTIGSHKKPSPGVHILNSHFVTPKSPDPERDSVIFETFLKNLCNSNCQLIPIQEAVEKIQAGQISKSVCEVAFTFDDGYEECYTVIAPLLEKYGVNGAFFLNANYIDSDGIYQADFNKRVKIESKRPLSWDQVLEMHHRGHVIGAHTLDHVRATDLTQEAYNYQLKENKRLLEKHLNYECTYFAWTYGNLGDFSKSALELTKKYHKTIFSGDNYKQYFSYNDKNVLNRRHAEAFWPFPHVKYFLAARKEYNLPKKNI